MNFKKNLIFFLLLSMLAAFLVPAYATETEEPRDLVETFTVDVDPEDVFLSDVGAALLIETNTDTVLFSLNANEKKYPASLTKIMTCLIALELGDPDEIITVSQSALDGFVAGDGTMSEDHLLAGEQMRLEDLLYLTMLESANEACMVLAEHFAGSVEAFVQLMNDKAAELGCTGTHFANPHGLHNTDHYTTARDMSILATEALKNPTFKAITSSYKYTLPATNMREARTVYTTNQLINKDMAGNHYFYSKASGVKTGFTTPAGRCLVSTVSDGELDFLSVIMQAQTLENEDGVWVYRSFPETINLCEWAFEAYEMSTVMSTLYPVAEIPVNMAAGSETVALAPSQEVRALMETGYDPKLITMQVELSAESVDAPIDAGTVLGTVTVTYEDRVLGTSPLTAITDIARSEVSRPADQSVHYAKDNWWKWLVGILGFIALIILVFVLVVLYYRRQQRKRRVAARRRALELQRRRREWNLPED